jgi:hypothetical protein
MDARLRGMKACDGNGQAPQAQMSKRFLVPLFFKKAAKKEPNHG